MFRTFTASAILALALTTAAQAGPAIVRFGDLDLSRPQDNRILNSRIQDAARSACAGLKTTHASLAYRAWFETCVGHASAHLTQQVAAVASKKPLALASK